MKKPLIFGGGNHLKILSLILFVTFLTLSCSAESSPPDTTREFPLNDIPTDFSPTDNIWIIESAPAPAEDDFDKLKIALKTAETENRKIKLEFPNIVTIPDSALNDTITSVVSVSAPLATSIEKHAFFNCSALTTVSLPLATTIKNRAFSECSALTTVSLPKVTTIENNAFLYCTALTTVSLPLVTSIGDRAFQYCDALKTVSLPLVTSIGESAFEHCSSLTTISLPLATTIGGSAFFTCSALTTVNLPLVTIIGNNAFASCTALTTMTIATKSTLLTLDPNVFFDVVTAKITVTTSTANASKFTGFKKVIEI